jgi:thiol-disulfide isomerase/thioredoxin
MRWFLRIGVLALVILTMGRAESEERSIQPEPQVDLQVVKSADLSKIIANHTGKVVVVDFWSVACTPCCQKFCHLVELHRKYASQGLIAVSVSLEENSQNKEVQQEVIAFLKKQKATFTNLLLDEPYEIWRDSLDIASPPCVMVFGRNGRWQKFDGEALDGDNAEGDAKIENLVEEWLGR